MKTIDLGSVVQQTIFRYSQNHVGDKPLVFVTLAPALTQVPWQDRTAEEFVRRLIYETLLTSDPGAPIEVSLRHRNCLDDLNDFIGIKPSYWIQLRVAGRGIRVAEYLIDELFGELGFRIEEWFASTDRTPGWEFSAPSTRQKSRWFSVWSRCVKSRNAIFC